jgi:transposase
MIPIPERRQIRVACGATDMRRGLDNLAMLVQDHAQAEPYRGHLFVFRTAHACGGHAFAMGALT